MATQPHSLLITAAARRSLKPLGLFQQGRSRTWLDDRDWWLIIVEFQPSGFGKGTYLNVGAMWLWQDEGHIVFNEGHRIAGFKEFFDKDQFAPIAEDYALRAASAVHDLRQRFPTFESVARFLRKEPQSFWDYHHAGIACGILGTTAEAARYFDQQCQSSSGYDWQERACSEARRLRSLLGSVDEFRDAVIQKIRHARSVLKLSPLQKIDLL